MRSSCNHSRKLCMDERFATQKDNSKGLVMKTPLTSGILIRSFRHADHTTNWIPSELATN
jgi:hypothetical protein